MLVTKGSCILLVVFLVSRLNADNQTIQTVYEVVCEPTETYCKKSLEAISLNLTEEEYYVRIDIKSTHLYLKENVSFSNLSSLMINGAQNTSTIINCTQEYAGILLENIENLTINNLTITLCGTNFFIRGKNYISALRLKDCNNVTITNVTIDSSRGIGLTIYQHGEGKVHIVKSNFTNNKLPAELVTDYKIRGGGGIYIGDFEDNSIRFTFQECYFERNVAHTKHYHSFYTNEFGDKRTGYGHGGGVLIAIKRDIINGSVKLLFSHCTFKKNEGFLGGGLAILISTESEHGNISNIQTTVENSVFISNGCGQENHTRIGGGVHLTYTLIHRSIATFDTEQNVITTFQDVHFSGNCAEIGGGAFILTSRYNTRDKSLRFDNCTFENNTAHTGSAVDITLSTFAKASDGYTITPVFINCRFLENVVHYIISNTSSSQKTAGIGTVYATQTEIKFEGENTFEKNNGTALYIVNGIGNFSASNGIFKGNRGIRGGAVALIGTSTLIVGLEKEYRFNENFAHHQGGAIYVLMIDNHDLTISRSCFIQLFNGSELVVTKYWNNTITFEGNSAQVGDAIFVTSLHPCQIINNGSDSSSYYITVNTLDIFSIRGIEINLSSVATAGARLQYSNYPKGLHIIPGLWYDHNVSIIDDMDNSVKEPLRATVGRSSVGTVRLDSDTSIYIGDNIKLLGKPGNKANLSLQTVST